MSYNYTLVVGYTITGSISLHDQMFMSPRISPPVYNGLLAVTKSQLRTRRRA